MAQKPSNLPLIIGIVVAGGVLLGINILQQDSDPAIVKKKQEEAERLASREEAKKLAEAGGQPAAPTNPAGGNDVALWGATKTFGKSGGKPTITVTWEWTPAVQGDPSTVQKTVETLTKAYPAATIVAVNADTAPGAGSPGVAIDKVTKIAASPDGTFLPEPALLAQLKRGEQ